MFLRRVLMISFCMYPGLVDSGNMLLFWGYPSVDSNYCVKTVSSGSFENCVNLCLARDECVASYGSNTNCMLCDTYNIQGFTQSNSSSGLMFAVKIDQQMQCPVDVKMGQYARTNENDSYTLQYSEPTWAITYKQQCPDNTSRILKRKAGPICMSVIFSGTINMTDAMFACRRLGPGIELAGMNSVEERQYIISTAKALIGHTHNKGYYTVWLGGNMRSQCYSFATRAPDCVGINAFTNFYYIDNFNAYQWTNNQPDFSKNPVAGKNYRCLQLIIGQDQLLWEGIVTNVMCEYACNGGNALCAMGYVCAGPAVETL